MNFSLQGKYERVYLDDDRVLLKKRYTLWPIYIFWGCLILSKGASATRAVIMMSNMCNHTVTTELMTTSSNKFVCVI